MITLLYSEPGLGKTIQAMLYEESVLFLDLENRAQKKLDDSYKNPEKYMGIDEKLIEIIPVKVIDDNFDDDNLASYYKLESEIKKIISTIKQDNSLFETLVIDGIFNIRNKFALAHWIEFQSKKGKSRIRPMPEEWTYMNDRTKELIIPLINMARLLNKNLVLTIQMIDEYGPVLEEHEGRLIKKNAKQGRMSGSKEWIDYDVDIVANLYHPDQGAKGLNLSKFMIDVIKSPIGSWSEDITGLSIYDVFVERGL